MTRPSQALSDAATGVLLLFAATVAYRILRLFYWPLGIIGGTVMTIAGICLLVRALRPTLKLLMRDPYSLDSLRDLNERDQNQPLEVPKEELHGVFCPRCNEVYPTEFGVCPRCGRSN